MLGLGSLAGMTKESSFWQLALTLEMRALLRAPLYFQDPAFTDVDARFLAAQQGTVLRCPEGEMRVGVETLLYAPHLEYEVLQTAVVGRPGVLVCNDLEDFLDTYVSG